MLTTRFGIEIEFTGITKTQAAKIAAEYLNGEIENTYDAYDTRMVTAPDGRIWKIMNDSSIRAEKTDGKVTVVTSDNNYRVELVSPILTYREDIEILQELVRKLRRAGGHGNNSCGIHIHLDGADHSPRSIRNFVNIIASHNDLFYNALQIEPERMRYCKKLDDELVERLNKAKPETFAEIADIWYAGYNESRSRHYHSSRYNFLNLHSFFTGNHTVELRGFNSELHAGKIRSYIVFALALNHQALTQKSASSRKTQEANPRFAMRTYLNRIGLIGDEFKNCREHLTTSLTGSAAWRYGNPA